MPEIVDISGQPRKVAELEQAYEAVKKELVYAKDFSPIFIHYTVILDALKELIAIRRSKSDLGH